MPQPLFDRWIVVDWSASAVPKRGKDSIWMADLGAEGLHLDNPPTRADAMALLAERLRAGAARGHRMIAGFDFPFGYPVGAAARVFGAAPGRAPWRHVWAHLEQGLEEGPRNANNRFLLAERLNAAYGPVGPFWGRPAQRKLPALPAKRPSGYGAVLPAERRLVETRVRRAQPVWKLAYAGAVGSQALTGIAALERLRHQPGITAQVWPFETGLGLSRVPQGSVVLAEIYPSLVDAAVRQATDAVKDAAQVRLLAEAFAALDRKGALGPLFAACPAGLPPDEAAQVVAEEGWILGVGFEAALIEALQPKT
ncbi:MAG: cobalamin biosynthesis protein CbiG [Pseudomonadota bacterium]